MIWNKEICKELADNNAILIVNEGFKKNDDGKTVPNIVIRRAVRAFGSKAGRDSYWGVEFDKKVEDYTGAHYLHILGYRMTKKDGRVQKSVSNLLTWINSHWLFKDLTTEEKAKIAADAALKIIE